MLPLLSSPSHRLSNTDFDTVFRYVEELGAVSGRFLEELSEVVCGWWEGTEVGGVVCGVANSMVVYCYFVNK